MKEYKVEVICKGFWTSKLPSAVEKKLMEQTALGWEIISISFGLNIWWTPTAYITFGRMAK